MKILAVGASLSTLTMGLALRSKGFSVQIAEKMNQQLFLKKINDLQKSVSRVHLKQITNYSNLDSEIIIDPNHSLKHSYANLDTFKALETLRLHNDDKLLKLPFQGYPIGLLSIYHPSGKLDLGLGLEFINSVQEILEKKKSIHNTIVERTSINKEVLFLKMFQQMKLIDNKSIQFSKKFQQFKTLGKNKGIEVEFENGSKEIFDLIICGDAEVELFREILNQNIDERKSIAISGITTQDFMNNSKSFIEIYRGHTNSFFIQKLSNGLWKWTITSKVHRELEENLNLKEFAKELIKKFSCDLQIVTNTEESLIFRDDFISSTFHPRGKDTIFIDPLIPTGKTMLGNQFNHPLIDISAHLDLRNAVYLQQALQKPSTNLFEDIIVPYELNLSKNHSELLNTLSLFHSLSNVSKGYTGIVNTFSLRIFKLLWNSNSKLYNSLLIEKKKFNN